MPPDPLADAHHSLVRRFAGLYAEPAVAGPLAALGLEFTTAPWGSVDVTLEALSRWQGQRFATRMPVLRHEQFADHKHVPLDRLRIRLGEPPRSIGLPEYLADLHARRSLLTTRDSHVQLGVQACLLPAPRTGRASFTPVVHNERARPGAPAVLVLLATREGTSATLVDYHRDLGRGGQRVLFDAPGQRTHLSCGTGPAQAIALIQIPLRQPPAPPDRFAHLEVFPYEVPRARKLEPEALGAIEGPFEAIDGLAIERDEDLPIRVTVQLFRAIDEPALDDALVELGAQLERLHTDPDSLTSLLDAYAT